MEELYKVIGYALGVVSILMGLGFAAGKILLSLLARDIKRGTMEIDSIRDRIRTIENRLEAIGEKLQEVYALSEYLTQAIKDLYEEIGRKSDAHEAAAKKAGLRKKGQ